MLRFREELLKARKALLDSTKKAVGDKNTTDESLLECLTRKKKNPSSQIEPPGIALILT